MTFSARLNACETADDVVRLDCEYVRRGEMCRDYRDAGTVRRVQLIGEGRI